MSKRLIVAIAGVIVTVALVAGIVTHRRGVERPAAMAPPPHSMEPRATAPAAPIEPILQGKVEPSPRAGRAAARDLPDSLLLAMSSTPLVLRGDDPLGALIRESNTPEVPWMTTTFELSRSAGQDNGQFRKALREAGRNGSMSRSDGGMSAGLSVTLGVDRDHVDLDEVAIGGVDLAKVRHLQRTLAGADQDPPSP